MANDFSVAETRMFEDVMEAFDSEPSTIKHVPLFTPDMQTFERSGLTLHRPVQNFSRVVTGLDITGNVKDVTELMYPVSITTDDMTNVAFQFDASELNDPWRREHKSRSVAQALVADLDSRTVTEVSQVGSQVNVVSGNADTYADFAGAEAILLEQGIPSSKKRTLGMPIRTWNNAASNLALSNGQFNPSTGEMAYRNSVVPNIAGFDTYRAQYAPSKAAAGGSSITMDGANQRRVPVSNNATSGLLEDNRFMNITVSATTNVAAGDSFTIAGVNSIDMIRKTDTGQLKTFRVIEVVDGTTLKISPAIIDPNHGSATQPELEYGNVSATPADTAAITFLNGAASTPSVFWVDDALEIIHGRINTDGLKSDFAVMESKTEKGITMYMMRAGNILTTGTTYRFSLWAKPTVNCPEAAGIVLDGQS